MGSYYSMGRVIMKSIGEHIPGVYSTKHITVRYYCDKCGSYNIASCWSFRIWFPLGLFILIIIFLNSTISLQKISVLDSIFLIIFLFVALIGSIYETGHKCIKCGYDYISDLNILNYPEGGNYHLDIPEELTHCHNYTEIE